MSKRAIITQSILDLRSEDSYVVETRWDKFKHFCLQTFPIIEWMSEYNIKRDLLKDFVAGLTVTVLQIPQGIAYGFLANVPPVCGIYTAIFGIIPYAVFGTSHHNNMGVLAVVCLMVGTSILNHTPNEDNLLIQDVDELLRLKTLSTITFTCSLILIAMYLLRLGVITNILSETLLNAFVAGCAIQLIFSQIRDVLGFSIKPRLDPYFAPFLNVYEVCHHIRETNLPTVGISTGAILLILLNKEIIQPRLSKKCPVPIPMEMFLVVISTTCAYFFNIHETLGVPILGDIEVGLPYIVTPQFNLIKVTLIKDCAFIALVSYTITMSMGFTFARKGSYEVSPNQELLALGLVDLLGTFFQCIPTCASLSRSVVQYNVGGVTQICTVIQAFLALIVLICCGGAIKYIPKCVLASIIMTSIYRTLFHIRKVVRYWRLSYKDGLVYVVTFLGTLVVIQIGLVVGVICAVCVILSHYWRPNAYLIGRVPDMELYMNTKFKEVREIPRIKIFRYEGGLNFASKNAFRNALATKVGINAKKIKASRRKAARKLKEGEVVQPFVTDIRVIILDISTLSHVDPAGSKTLRNLETDFKDIGITLLLVTSSNEMRIALTAYDAIEAPSHSYTFFVTIHDAVLYAQEFILDDNT